jgi:ABC-type glutathione transport system ATPase component
MASILKPALIIADEPTTALDVETGEAVLHIIKKINEKFKNMIILISHDLKVIKKMCSRVVVMKSGEIVEVGNTSDIFANPKDDYTKRLIASIQTYEKANKKTENKPLVEIDNLSLFYNEKKGESIFAKTEKHYIAEGICFTINKGEILGLLGGSGCGKSTLSRVLAGLKHNYEGNIRYIGENKEDKINIKMVFQDPYSSLNPSMTIGEIISEPLRNQKKSSVKHTKEDIRQQVEAVLELIGLDKEYYNRYPSELSGGQRQRVSIGAAIISKPQLIIADEPVSALDATICQQILELFVDIQKKYETTILMISHDVSVLEKTCDRIIKWENIKN